MVPSDTVASIRMRAELARRLAGSSGPKAAKALREIARQLDAEADRLEDNVVRMDRHRPNARE